MSGVNDWPLPLAGSPIVGSRRDRLWWRTVFEDPVIARVGVPVMFLPRAEHGGRRCVTPPGFTGELARVVLAPVEDGARYPGEACLWNVQQGALLFGQSWQASGDLLVCDALFQRFLFQRFERGGAHE